MVVSAIASTPHPVVPYSLAGWQAYFWRLPEWSSASCGDLMVNISRWRLTPLTLWNLFWPPLSPVVCWLFPCRSKTFSRTGSHQKISARKLTGITAVFILPFSLWRVLHAHHWSRYSTIFHRHWCGGAGCCTGWLH